MVVYNPNKNFCKVRERAKLSAVCRINQPSRCICVTSGLPVDWGFAESCRPFSFEMVLCCSPFAWCGSARNSSVASEAFPSSKAFFAKQGTIAEMYCPSQKATVAISSAASNSVGFSS